VSVGRTFDAKGAAEYLGCHIGTIQAAANKGTLEGTRNLLRSGRPWFFTKEQLDAFQATMLRSNSTKA
jgi:excisionase family DNA binding protein